MSRTIKGIKISTVKSILHGCGFPNLELSELVDDWFMCQKVDVFDQVIRLVNCASLVNSFLVLWLMWIDSFQNT